MKHSEVKVVSDPVTPRSLSAITEMCSEICEFAMIFWCFPER
jgi:hypothetical protein